MEGYYGTLFDVETSAMNDASSSGSGRYLSDRGMTIAGGTTEIQRTSRPSGCSDSLVASSGSCARKAHPGR